MPFIRRFLSRCFLFVEKLKGNKSVKDVSTIDTEDLAATLVGYSVSGYEIRIYCHRMRYRKQYSRWFVPASNIDLYNVYCIVSNDAPASLKEACALQITIPSPHPDFLSDAYQKEAAIEWYLDLLIERMRPEDRFNS